MTMTASVAEEWVAVADVAVVDPEVAEVEAVEVPEDVAESVSLTASPETPGLESRPRIREEEVEKETGATLKMTSR